MKIKATAKELKNADVRFISLVKRGANRIPFRILKTDKGENQMIDLSALGSVLKGEKIQEPAKKAYSPNRLLKYSPRPRASSSTLAHFSRQLSVS